MSLVLFSSIAGVAFGTLAVVLMLPMAFPNKRRALCAAFASRFAIGFIVPATNFPVPSLLAGAIVGLLISLPDAIVTKAYAPILIVGTVAVVSLVTYPAHMPPNNSFNPTAGVGLAINQRLGPAAG